MPLNKPQLRVLNDTNFPDNTSQLITPALLRDFNDEMITSLQLTQSMSEYAVLSGSNTFVGNQNITGNLTVTGTLTVPVIHTIYETASVIYSSGSNQFGDELTDVQTLSGSVKIQGNLTINGIPLSSGSDLTSLNAFTQSQNTKNSTLATYTASVDTKFTTIGTYTASNDTKWNTLSTLTGSYATTGSNRFTGNQYIDKANVLYTNGIYWTSSEAGYNNLEIINSATGNLDLAALNGRVRVVSSSLDITNGTFTSSLQQGYVWVGNGSGRTTTVATSSFAENTDLTSLNAFTASQEILNTTFATTGSNTFTGVNTFQQQVTLNNGSPLVLNASDNQILSLIGVQNTSGSLVVTKLGNANKVDLQNLSLLVSGTFTSSLQQGYVWVGDSNGRTTTVSTSSLGGSTDLSSLNAFTSSQNTKNSTLATYTASVDTKFSTIGTQSGSWDNTSLNSYTASQDTKNSTLATYTASVDQKFSNIGSQSGSWITESETGSFVTTNTSQTITGVKTFQTNIGVESTNAIQFGSFDTNRIFSDGGRNITLGAIYVDGANTVKLTAGTTGPSPSGADTINIRTLSTNVGNQILLESKKIIITGSTDINGSLTASLQSGYAWVGNSSNISALVATSSFASTPTDISALNAFTQSQETKNSTLSTYTASVDTKFSTLGSQSGSWITESETGSFARTNVDNNFSANQTFTNITAVSASFTYVQTLYETSSVIYSSGSNQFGDELSDIQTLSGSVKIQGNLTINGTPVQTSSVDISSLNAFTQSQDTKNNTLGSYTASVDTQFVAVGSSTASLNSYTQSQDTKNSTLATYTGSNDTKWNTLGGQTGSYVTSGITGSSLITASVSLNTITFTKGDATTFNVTVNTGSAVTTDISALNSFTQSQDTKNSTLASYTASVDTKFSTIGTQSGSWDNTSLNSFTQSVDTKFTAVGSSTASLNAYTQSNDTKWSTLGGLTGSYVTSAITGSSLVTASFSGNTLTFTKGDSSTFGVIIPDVSGSTIPTGTVSSSQQILNYNIFATTGSNQFTGNQAIDGTLTITGKIIGSQSLILQPNANDARTLEIYNTSPADTHITASGGELYLGNDETYVLVNTYANQKLVTIRGDQGISASGSLSISGSLTASLQQGYVWVGDGNNRTQLVPTSSFAGGSTNTGSLMVTGSVSGNILTFTKGDSSQFSLTVATGSGGGGSTDTGSLLVTASFNTSTRNITFTKGDASQFNISGFATTGSNNFVGVNNFSSSGVGEILNIIGPARMTLGGTTMLYDETAFINMVEGDGTNQGGALQFQISNGGAGFVCSDAPSGSTQSVGNTAISFENNTRSGSISFTNNGNTGNITFQNNTGSINLRAGNSISISGSSTTIQDVNFIPFSASLNSRILAITGSGGGGGATLGANTFTGSQLILTGSSGPNNTLQVGTDDRSVKLDFNAITITNPTQANVTFNAPDTYWLNAGSLYFQNFNSFDVGSGSVNFSLKNGGSYLTQAMGGGTINFTTNTGSISLTTPDILNLQSNVLKLKSADANFTTQIINVSGSLMLAAAAQSTASAYIAQSSPANSVNLIFKNNSNTGATTISGSNNIFTNPNTPTTGYTRYIGGSNNLYLNQTNGINSQITQSAASVSGNRPTMNGNIMPGTGDFIINQATNPGTHTYSSNIIFGQGGQTAINALGFTGSLNITSNISSTSGIIVNAASASVAEIAAGISGSGTVNTQQNYVAGGSITNTSPRTLLTSQTQTVANNVVAGTTIAVTNISSSLAVNALGNIATGTMNYLNAGAAGLALHRSAGSMSTNFGAMQLIASASSINASGNISPTPMTVTNRMWSGSLGSGSITFANNQIQGGGNTYTVTGSWGTTGTGATMAANGIFGLSNTIFTNVEGRGGYADYRGNIVGGSNLILTGSNNITTLANGGAYFGRYNADDGRRNGTGENILVVGTGTSTTRKTGFLIDSGSNTFVEGSLNVSGSTQFTGSISIAPTFEAKFATGSNQQAGTAVLDGGNPGTAVISNSLVTANSIIMLTKQTFVHTNSRGVAVVSKGAGTFTISSGHNGDTDTVGWFIINNS
jgi:hypothetical protein